MGTSIKKPVQTASLQLTAKREEKYTTQFWDWLEEALKEKYRAPSSRNYTIKGKGNRIDPL